MFIEYLSLRPRSRLVTRLINLVFLLGVGYFGVLAQAEASNSLNVTIIGYGRITSNPAGINCGSDVKDCTKLYDINTEVELTASPQDGDLYENNMGIVRYVVDWSGDCGTTEWATEPYPPKVNKVTMDTVKNCVVTFTETPLKILPKHWTGTQGKCGYGINSYGVYYTDGCMNDSDCDYGLSYGREPMWCGEDDSRRDDDIYRGGLRALNLTVVGKGTITATEGGHEVCSGEDCTAKLKIITRGAEVKLTATASAGYKFSGWSPAQCASPFLMPDNDNLICTATFKPITCESHIKHAKYSIATGRVSIPFTDLPALKTDSPDATGGMAVFKNLRLQFFKDQDFKVVTSTVTPDTSKEPVGDPCHAVYTYATRTLKIPRVEVPSIISTFPAITEGKPINVYEVTLQHIETNPVDLGIVRIKDATLIETIK